MCGLVSILHFDGGRPDAGVLRAMAQRIRHRGPDDTGEYLHGPLGLAHQRLSIIDLTTGHQPMSFDGITLVFNGEIYNYVELRDELQRAGHVFRTTSDTEVLLRMYLQYGTDAIARLNGMFAFVLFDEPRGRIVAARDHFGIKPLYLHRNAQRLVYASEIKALLADPDIAARVDPQGLHDYVTLQYTLGDTTLFGGIHKLPPAHFEVVSLADGSTRRERYWTPSFEPDYRRSEADFVSELQELLRASVRRQMRSDVPVGAYLSGGLDSSTVTVLAARETSTPIKTFTGAFREGPEFDESDYARAVAGQCGAQMFFVHPTEREFVDLLPKLAYHMDEPAAGPGLFPQFIVSRLAAQHVKVCLGGQGGDEIFGGYARYAIAYLEQAIKAAVHGGSEEGEEAIALADLAPNLACLRQYQPLMQRFLGSGLFEAPERRYFALMDRSEGALDAFSPAFREQYCHHGGHEAVFGRFRRIFNEPDTSSYYNRMLYYDMMTGLPSLLHVEDRVSMAVSLESRVPLLDPAIVELVARAPARVKFRGGEMKYLFRQAIRDLLPPRVFNRQDKMGFPVPLQHWARGPAREFFADVLLSQRTRERGLFDMVRVERLMREASSFSRALWGLLQLELWHREFIDAGGSRSMGVIHAA
jgi:asparagine synthase (glutamine-hydrolysing)